MAPSSSFRSMGVEVVVGGADATELAAVRSLFEEWDGVFSRFRPDSELSLVNRCPQEVVVVSALFGRAVREAIAAAGATDGLVDMTLGVAIEVAGYDRDFTLLAADERRPGLPAPGRWRTVQIVGRFLRRPRGTRLDLNGVVKALAVDEALARLGGAGFVSAGGDVAASAAVTVGLPHSGCVCLERGGLATSSTTRRPVTSTWTDVTVAAGTCLAADVAAKAALLLSTNGPDWLDERGLPGRFVGREGVFENRSWRRRVREGAAA